MASGYFITGIGTKNLLKLVKRNGISPQPKYLFRFSLLLLYSFCTSACSVVEKALYSKTLKQTRCPENPIIIIGHWRSGTSFLHQLFNAMPGFKTPTMFEIGTPESFLVSKKILSPLLQKFLPDKRNVDNVKFGIGEPQEDEYAIFRATTHSPVEKLIFPEEGHFFLNEKQSYVPPDSIKPVWEQTLTEFCAKLHLDQKERIVLKNPFHSMRIPYLRAIFPNVKFIHIYRDPLKVVPSTMRMWSIDGQYNTLRKGFTPPDLDDVIAIYDRMLTKIRKDLGNLPAGDHYTVSFEDLERKPIETLENACRAIEVDITPQQKKCLSSFVKPLRTYKKNKYKLSQQQKQRITSKLKHHYDVTWN
jgi:hypothetical protein